MNKKYIEKLNSEQKEYFSLNFLYAQHHPPAVENLKELEIRKSLISSLNNNTNHLSFDFHKNISTPLFNLKGIKLTLEVI